MPVNPSIMHASTYAKSILMSEVEAQTSTKKVVNAVFFYVITILNSCHNSQPIKNI